MKFNDPTVIKKSDPEKEWFEVWYEGGVNYYPSWLVVVLPNPENQEEIIVVDTTKNKIIYRSRNYEDVRNWLLEDGFGLITGRESNYV